MLTLSAWLLPSAEAQPAPSIRVDQSGSHRRLPLPSNGTPDLKQQMFLMKQLKTLLSDQSAAGNPEQNRLQDALKAVKDKLPAELRPMLDNLPPAVVEQVMADPAVKEQMKQVLEQYSKSRQIPEVNPPQPPSTGTSPGVTPGASSGENGRNTDSAYVAKGESGKPSVAEFLELMQGVIPADSQPPTGSNATAPSSGEASDTAADAADRERLAEQVRRKQQDAKQDLQQLGLHETLNRIVNDAKKEAQQQIAARQSADAAHKDDAKESATDDATGGRTESMLKSLGGLSRDLIDMVKDARFKPAGDQQSAGDSARVTAEPAQPSAARSLLNNLRNTTTELLADIEEPPAPRAPTTADELPAEQAAPTSLADLMAQWLLPVLLLSVLLTLLLRRSGVIVPSSMRAGAMSQITEVDVQSKADVVRAFHRMALQPTRATEHWWTHQMVARDIRDASPGKDEQVRILTRLYEQARYLPQDVDFTPEQIREAQSALKCCET